jgi:hypothetical protein
MFAQGKPDTFGTADFGKADVELSGKILQQSLRTVNLLIQPNLLEAQIVVLAVVVRVEILQVRLPAIADRAEQDARTRGVIDEQTLDLPDDFGPLIPIQGA